MSILVRTFYKLSSVTRVRPRVLVLNKPLPITTHSLSLTRSLSKRWTDQRQSDHELDLPSDNTRLNKVFAEWHSKQTTASPCAKLQYLIAVTNLIRVTNNYRTLSTLEFKRLLQATVDSAMHLSAEQIVSLLWVMGKIKWADYGVIKKLVDTLHNDLRTLSDKSIGLIPWALVTLKIANSYTRLINRILKEASRRLVNDSFHDVRAMANICWAMAIAKTWPEYFTPLVEKFIRSHKQDMSPHTLSMFLHALSKSDNLKNDKWLFEVIGSSFSHLKNMDQQSLILILWSMGNTKVYDAQLFNQLENEILSGSLVKLYNPRMIATLLWCLARCQYYSEELLHHLSHHMAYFLRRMSPQDLGMAAYSLGFLNFPCQKLLRILVDRVMELHAVQPMSYQVLLNCSWACLVNQLYPRDLFESCMNEEMIQRVLVGQHKALNHVHQLLQLDVAGRFEQTGESLPLLSPQNRLQMLINAATFSIKQNSKFQMNVATVLTEMYGCVHSLNMETFSSTGYRLDFELLLDKNNSPVLPQSGLDKILTVKSFKRIMSERDPSIAQELELAQLQMEGDSNSYNLSADWFVGDSSVARQIAIEVDGPTHFAANIHHPLGRTALKYRQLKAFGWEVVSVPYYEWCEFGLDQNHQMKAYIAEKLTKQR